MSHRFPVHPVQREELSKLTIEELADVHDNVVECFQNLIKHKAWERSRKDGHYSHDHDGLLDTITERFTLVQISRELNIFLEVYFEMIQENAEEEDKYCLHGVSSDGCKDVATS